MNNNFSEISGGVCAPKGFKASGVHCGIRHNRTKNDIAMIFSEVPASAAAVYTQNLVKGAPLTVTKKKFRKVRRSCSGRNLQQRQR
ncbi:MAG: bifunctional ornithine acetyltransferase/N-acetylglutamate synthase [Synergistaceae bacterium]|nr:bifunctional ornithine acetyltransferase/N-acetylglutamate synthase [Synergistaceae bacterium]